MSRVKRLEIDLLHDLQMHKGFGFAHAVDRRQFFSDKAQQVLVVPADHFGKDVKAATGNDHVNDFIEPGNFFSHIQQLAPLGPDADHGHGPESPSAPGW